MKDYTFEPGGKSTSVFGANAAGKTTIYDAMSWLLFDKDSLGQSTFEIKPKDSSRVEVEVEGTFLNGDSSVILKKIYKEKWTKKRGSVQLEFTGHETEYYIDAVPVNQAKYKAKVGEIATKDDIFRLLTSPTYSNEQMHWSKRRELLFEICGNVTDAQIIDANPELAELPKILGGKPADDYKKIVMASRKKINEAIEGIPARIDEQTRSKPELTVTNPQTIIKQLTKLREELAGKNQSIALSLMGGGAAELNTKLAEIDGEIQQLRNDHQQSINAVVQALKNKLTAIEDKNTESVRLLRSMESDKAKDEFDIGDLQETNTALKTEWRRLTALVFTEGCCPTCKQDLPEDQVEAARLSFNENKAIAIYANIEKGKANAARIKALTENVASLTASIVTLKSSIADIDKQVAALTTEIATAKSNNLFENTGECTAKNAARAKILDDIKKLASGSSETSVAMAAEKKVIEDAIAENEKHLAKIEQVQQADTRIAELKAEEKKLAGEFANLEKHLFLIESFIRAKVSSLEESINSKFNIIKWKLFKEQINGGIEEICEATVEGVGYNSINHASRIAAGLECVQVFGDYYNFHPVIFVDGRESVTELPEMTAQIISLVVSPKDATLRIAA
jgi:chromosome segregation ATPase